MSTILSQSPDAPVDASQPGSNRQKLLMAAGFIVLLIIALLMRLHTLGLPFDRDSYDEGVYWQTLRSLSNGHPLYTSTFYSQPPMFILSIFPTYQLLGQTLWAARFGIVLVSLLGLVGAFLLGSALRGRTGALLALLLLVSNQAYLSASQTIQAEGPQVAYTLLAMAFVYLWWKYPDGWRGSLYAGLCTLTLALSIFSKLFAVSDLAPIGLLVLAYLWRVSKLPAKKRFVALRSLLIGILVFILACVIIMLPYLNSLPQFWSGVISFHTSTSGTITRSGNDALLGHFLLSPLGFAALIGTVLALYRRDWHVIPFLAWLIVSLFILWRQTPLFVHHLVILVPPLVALTILGLGPLPFKQHLRFSLDLHLPTWLTSLTLLVILVTVLFDIWNVRTYYHHMAAIGSSSTTQHTQSVAHDLTQAIGPQQYVITDTQFAAALAGRSTPPQLVDTSSVRITTGYLTAQQLIQDASQPQVQAVLFYTGRLTQLPTFHTWVTQHFQLVHRYGKGSELWVKIR